MRKLWFCKVFIFTLLLIPAVAFAALNGPNFSAVINYNGPLVAFWNTNGNPAGTQYLVFFSTSPLNGLTYSAGTGWTITGGVSVAPTIAPLPSSAVNQYASFGTGAPGDTTGPTNGLSYYAIMAAFDGVNFAVSSMTFATSQANPIVVSQIIPYLNGVKLSTDSLASLDYDTDSLNFEIDCTAGTDSFGKPIPFLPAAQNYVTIDLQTQVSPKSILTKTSKQFLTVVNISSDTTLYKAFTDYSWDGYVPIDTGHKHNGGYDLVVDPDGNSDYEFDEPIYVDVCHVNVGLGVVYQTQGSASGAQQISYGPPFNYDYYLSENSYVTMTIWNMNQQSNPNNYTLERIVVSSAPMVCGDSPVGDPAGWNKNVNRQVWDGRDSQGNIVPNGIYAYSFEAANFWAQPGSLFSTSTVDTSFSDGTIAYDVLRIINVASSGINQANPVANIKYTLTGASSQTGGAKIKIVICSPGTTYYIASSSGSVTYLGGNATYYYLVGDPLPFNPQQNIKKVFNFNRIAGDQVETWNGYDDAGNALPNNTYIFAISGTDDSGNHAIDNSGNNGIIGGNITIDRTLAQLAGDTTPPVITAISVNNINISSTTAFSQPFNTIVISLTDNGGSGVDFTNTLVSLVNSSGYVIAPSTSTNDNVGTITLTYPQQSTNGTYTLTVTPVDKAGNKASPTISTFSLNVTQTGAQASFDDSIVAYPNPAKGQNTMTFGFTLAAISPLELDIFNIMGELIYSDNWTPTATGAQTRTWKIVNSSGKRLATGVYLYRISANGSTSKNFKKIVVVQ
jgi:flagellar hook assembly protein FlgD